MKDLLSRFNEALAALSYPVQPKGLYEPIAYTLDLGGKRIRPLLTLLTYRLYRDDIETVMPAALGLETYHNFTLLHDDLMDNADVRRGQPSVHRKWDANTAILSGDTMLILAFQQVANCRCARRDELTALFARTALEVCEGQQYDMNFERQHHVSAADYIEMIRLKTAVLVACAAKMGALAADAPAADAELLYAFAEKIGLAFQLQDDYLDVYGDPAVFGKAVGGDILEGKKTYLLLSALDRAEADTKAFLLRTLDDESLSAAEKIETVTAVYDALDVPTICRQAIDAYFDEAHALYERLSLPEEKKRPLRDFARMLLNRRS